MMMTIKSSTPDCLKPGVLLFIEMHILFKHGFQISAKGRGQLFDVSAGGVHKKVVVFPHPISAH